MSSVKKWLSLSFSLLKELAKNPLKKCNLCWSEYTFPHSDTFDEARGNHFYKYPPNYEPKAASRKIVCHHLQGKDTIHPVYFLPLDDFKPKRQGPKSDIIDNWGLPLGPDYTCSCGKDIDGDVVEKQFVKGLKAKKINHLASLKEPSLPLQFNITATLLGTSVGDEDAVTRIFRIPSNYRLSSVAMFLEAFMGWEQDKFAYVFNDKDGAVYGPVKSKAVDAHLLRDFQGPVSLSGDSGIIDDRTISIGQVLREEGDSISWTHNLKSKWIHTLELDFSDPYEETELDDSWRLEPVSVYQGYMRCPPEDGGGNAVYREKLESLWCRKRSFARNEWDYHEFFDDEACDERVADLMASERYKEHLQEITALDKQKKKEKKVEDQGRTSKKGFDLVDRLSHLNKEFGITVPEEINTPSNLLKIAQSAFSPDACAFCPDCVKDECDLMAKKCAVCGSKENGKLCTACKKVYYCSVACQKKDWKAHHMWQCEGSPHFIGISKGFKQDRAYQDHKTEDKVTK